MDIVVEEGVGHVCELCLNSHIGGNAWTLKKALRVALVGQDGSILAEAEVGPDCLQNREDQLMGLLQSRIGRPGPYTITQNGDRILVVFPPDRDLIAAVRAIPLARFDRNHNAWILPAAPEVIQALNRPPLNSLRRTTPLTACTSWLDAAVTLENGALALRLPYNSRVIERLRAVPRKWHDAQKMLTFPVESAGAAAEAIEPVFPDVARRIRELVPDAPPAVTVNIDTGSWIASVSFAIRIFDGAAGALRHAGARWTGTMWKIPSARLDVVARIAEPFKPTVFPERLRGKYLVLRDRDTGEIVILNPGLRRVEAVPDGAPVELDPAADLTPPSPPPYLWPYQAQIYPRLVAGNLLMALDVGLGKTVITIAGLQTRHRFRSLVITPASVKWQWVREIRRFAPELRAIVLEGDAKDRATIIEEWIRGGGILITNYDLLLRHEKLVSTPVDVLVLDEAQRIKTGSAKRTRLVRKIPAGYVWALTGTPIENHPIEVYNILMRVAPTLLPSWPEFDRDHIVRGRFNEVIGFRDLRRFADRISPAVIRLRKTDVLHELPPLRLVERDVEFDGDVDRVYRALEREAIEAAIVYADAARRREAADKLRSIRANALAKVLRLRQFCDHPALIGLDLPGPKLEILAEELDELLEVEPKAIVFTQFVEMIPYIAERLRNHGTVIYHGGMNDREREAALERFRSLENVRVLISSDAGSEGLNLQMATVVVNYDLPWTPARLTQRLGRAHRAGQTRPVLGLILLAPADRPVLQLLQRKARLAEIVLAGSGLDEAALSDPLAAFCQAHGITSPEVEQVMLPLEV